MVTLPSSWQPGSSAILSLGQVTVTFRRHIAADQPLRTGTYARTLTFTLSTTAP
jgi:hypothetical protein